MSSLGFLWTIPGKAVLVISESWFKNKTISNHTVKEENLDLVSSQLRQITNFVLWPKMRQNEPNRAGLLAAVSAKFGDRCIGLH